MADLRSPDQDHRERGSPIVVVGERAPAVELGPPPVPRNIDVEEPEARQGDETGARAQGGSAPSSFLDDVLSEPR